MSRVAFTRFCRQIHQSARIGVRGGGGGVQANLGNARIFTAPITEAPPLWVKIIVDLCTCILGKPLINHQCQWSIWEKHSMVMVWLRQNHWKTIEGNGAPKKNITIQLFGKNDHRQSLVFENNFSLWNSSHNELFREVKTLNSLSLRLRSLMIDFIVLISRTKLQYRDGQSLRTTHT